MKRFLKDQRGFTLIEMMMVVLVIGILAAVLVPKLGGVQDSARLSGVDSNVRQVEAQVYAVAERNKNDADAFELALKGALSEVVNPFDASKEGALVSVEANDIKAAVAVGDAVPKNHKNNAGLIHVETHIVGGKVVNWVEITPYDQKGHKMTGDAVRKIHVTGPPIPTT